ncbi:MAG: phage major capsid protein [Clostridiales bacterium]|nr:phage major capsid protein [Clostridiales bacterium]
MVTTQTADKVLKSYYLDAVSDMLNLKVNPLLARIKQTTSDVWGKDVRKTMRIGVNGGIGAGTEDGDLPDAKGNQYEQFVTTLKNLYGKIEITDKAIRASQNNEGAFVNLLNDEMEGLIRSSSFNLSRMLYGDGSGRITSATSVHPTTAEMCVASTSALEVGMVVDVMQDDAVKYAAQTITSIDRSRNAIRFESMPAFSMPSGATIWLAVQGSYNAELTGLKGIFNNTSLYGVTRGGKPWMTPVSVKQVGDDLEANMLQSMDLVEERTGNKTNFIVCSFGVRRALVKALLKNRTVETLNLEGGFTAISYNGIPVIADRFCPKGTMYLLNTDDFALHQLCDWQWLEGEDGKILKQIPGKPVYTATLVKYAELMCYRPYGQIVLEGITEG